MNAIIYTSNTGHTKEYANILSQKTGLPVIELNDALMHLKKDTPVIYLGWLFANQIKGYKKAKKRFVVSSVCAVGLCDTGTAIKEVRKANSLPESTPLFTVQGGMDKTKLHGINKFMIDMLTKSVSRKANRSEDDERMLYLLNNDKNYVCEENLSAFMEWYNKQ